MFLLENTTTALVTYLILSVLSVIYVIVGVVKRKDNYIWIAAAFAAPPIAALMYYLQKRRERSNKTT